MIQLSTVISGISINSSISYTLKYILHVQLNVGGGEDSCSEVKEDDGGTESSRSNSAAVKRNKKKKNRKKVTKASKAAAVKSSEDNLEDIEDEIDRSVREVNKILGKAPNAQESTTVSQKYFRPGSAWVCQDR